MTATEAESPASPDPDDVAAWRERVARLLREEAETSLLDMHRDMIVFDFSNHGDPDVRYSQHEILPGPQDRLNLMKVTQGALAELRLLKAPDPAAEAQSGGLNAAVISALATRLHELTPPAKVVPSSVVPDEVPADGDTQTAHVTSNDAASSLQPVTFMV